MADPLLEETQNALVSRWGMSPLGKDADLSRQRLLEALAERIGDLMRRDYERLLSALYMLDVSEAAFREAMRANGTEAKAFAVAELVLERETRKVFTWLKYAEQRRRDQAGRIEEESNHADE